MGLFNRQMHNDLDIKIIVMQIRLVAILLYKILNSQRGKNIVL